MKIDLIAQRETRYHYDWESPTVYGSKNNRLMLYETMNTAPNPDVTLSKTYYVYAYDSTDERRAGKSDGNVTRLITESPPSGGAGEAASASSTESAAVADPGSTGAVSAAVPSGDGAAAMAAPPPTGKAYSAVRLGYAANGRMVTFAHRETWTGSSGCPTDYTVTYAREFRYDGARSRYMNRKLSADLVTDLGTTWSDYDGDEIYGDFTVSGSTVTNVNSYEPGAWRKLGSVADYLHNDMLGTLRQTTGTTGTAGASRVFTAFGERISKTTDRFGYVGAYGYQSTLDARGEVFPFLHLGARYYDPSSGRFLQRDPIGILGGLNVYSYVSSSPAIKIDPNGLQAPSAGDVQTCQDACDRWVPAPTCTGRTRESCYFSCGEDYWPTTTTPTPRPGFKPWPGPCPPVSTPSPPGPKPAPRPIGSSSGKPIVALVLMVLCASIASAMKVRWSARRRERGGSHAV